MSKQQKEQSEQVTIPAIEVVEMLVTLVGDSPLIVHAWDQKTLQGMLDKQQQKPKQQKGPRDPHQEYLASLYPRPEGGYGFPSTGLKKAVVAACRFVDGLPMTVARGALFIMDTLTPIEGEPQMREDVVRIGRGIAQSRFRGEFPLPWKAHVRIRYNAKAVSPGQVVNLLNSAGFGVGIGEWRPERNGSFGMFHVAEAGDKKSSRK